MMRLHRSTLTSETLSVFASASLLLDRVNTVMRWVLQTSAFSTFVMSPMDRPRQAGASGRVSA